MIDPRSSAYGDTHAKVYDRIYGARFAPDAAVDVLAQTTGQGGHLLELGLGTGRLAIPLIQRGVRVDGIEASTDMIAQLRAQADAAHVGVFQVDLTDFDLPRTDYDVAVCAVSTLFMLPDRAAQQSCLTATARHLRPGGRLFIEAFRPDPSRYDAEGYRVENRPSPDGSHHRVRSRHSAAEQRIDITHELSAGTTLHSYHVSLHYATPEELDQMATAAGLSLSGRWHDWTETPATESSTDPISIYAR